MSYKRHWMSDWNVEINMKFVKFAKRLLKHPLFKSPKLDFFTKVDGQYIIKNVYVTGYTVKDEHIDGGYVDKGAVFFSKEGLIKLGESYYPPLRFSIPKTHILKTETSELDVEQTILITEWGYENCILLPINKIYEDWGKHIFNIIAHYGKDAWETTMFTSSPYYKIVEEMKKMEIREDLKRIRRKENVFEDKRKDKKPNNKRNDENNFRKEALYTFYTDGSGNWYSDGKRAPKGHFSVFLKNTKERWKHSEDKLTSNQAELLGVMSAVSIAEQKGFKNVLIYTDSKNVVEWITKNPDKKSGYNWNAKSPNIVSLVDRLRVMSNMIPKLEIKHVMREKNIAHEG